MARSRSRHHPADRPLSVRSRSTLGPAWKLTKLSPMPPPVVKECTIDHRYVRSRPSASTRRRKVRGARPLPHTNRKRRRPPAAEAPPKPPCAEQSRCRRRSATCPSYGPLTFSRTPTPSDDRCATFHCLLSRRRRPSRGTFPTPRPGVRGSGLASKATTNFSSGRAGKRKFSDGEIHGQAGD